MPFPLPLDPSFRLEVASQWAEDVKDRIELGDISGAKKSWTEANKILLGLPAGFGNRDLEEELAVLRVSLV